MEEGCGGIDVVLSLVGGGGDANAPAVGRAV
jgi:hypothetical protein